MDLQLQKVNQSLGLSDKELIIAQAVFHVNQLVPYALTDLQISDWAKSINKLIPELDIDSLVYVIDQMKMGRIEWNPKLGIQNLFVNLLETDESDFLSNL